MISSQISRLTPKSGPSRNSASQARWTWASIGWSCVRKEAERRSPQAQAELAHKG